MDNGRRVNEDAFLEFFKKYHAPQGKPVRTGKGGRVQQNRASMPRSPLIPTPRNKVVQFNPLLEVWNAAEPVPPLLGSQNRFSVILQEEKDAVEYRRERLRSLLLEQKRRIHRQRWTKIRLIRETKRELELLEEEEQKVNAEITGLEDKKGERRGIEKHFKNKKDHDAFNQEETEENKNTKEQSTREMLKKLEDKLKRDKRKRRRLQIYGEKYGCIGFNAAARTFVGQNTRADTVGYAVSENNGVLVLRSDGRCQIFGEIPSKLKSYLRGRSIGMTSMGSNGRFFLQYRRGTKPSHAGFADKEVFSRGPVQCVAFGQSGRSYFVLFKDGSMKYEGVPRGLERDLEIYGQRTKPVFISLGYRGEYFVRFANGIWRFGAASSPLVQQYLQKLHFDNSSVRSVVFGVGTAIVRYNS